MAGTREQELIRGTVAAVLYQNQENGYSVIRFTTDQGVTITVVGTIPMCTPGEHLAVTGHWEDHTTHGPQFRAEFLERVMPSGAEAIETYLSSRAIKGIGPRTASRIVKLFGDQTFEIMEQHPERLAEVPGISPQKAKAIGQSFQKQFGMRKLLEFLLSNGLPGELAMPLYKAYGDLAMDALRDDPYLLTEDYFGAAFAAVDQFAVHQGIEAEDFRRVQAATVYTLRHNLGNGHTFLPAEKLCAATATMINVDPDVVRETLGDLNLAGKLVVDTLRDISVCYLPEYYEAETYVAQRMLELSATPQQVPDRLEGTLRAVQQELGTEYASEQARAILTAARSSVMLLTGGPGTGKTTTVNGILGLFDRLGIKTVLAAPTGRAANRLKELCGREAATIHRLLETQFDPESGKLCFMHDESEPLKADAVVVDETSMVDILLMEALLRALKPQCRLILVGDPDQLPSVGAGNLFSDLIRSKKIPTVRLTEIFRQARESLIIMNAHAINGGQLPELTVKNKDFFFLQRRDMQRAVDTIVDLCVRRLPQNMGIPADQIQVLSPTRKNEAGTAALNLRLQAVLNPPAPGKQEHKRGKMLFRVGDRVMQIKNNYDIMWKKTEGFGVGTGVFNGDVGKVTEIDPGQETMTVVFDDRQVEYTFDLLGQLELAYAMTVHKSQGSEYRAVILSVSQANPYLLTRSILYTAVTRARELLILVGDPGVVQQMVENNRQSRRYSGLKLRLEKDG
ncbi:MAG: ATP-dependent RecD-like DNA helicase [Oscillospiraceae bacterium]|nr:ATP-dependent RecD-like DNA helicase [Oscillospiraceae bacterium]